MKTEVINTGTELLLGNVINTHVAYFGQQLFKLGLRINRQTCIPDGSEIGVVLQETFGRCDVVLVTGGLGPTTDDITREVVAELLGRELLFDESILKSISERLTKRSIPVQERMKRQTMVPKGAAVLVNHNGTAPGLYLPATRSAQGQTPHIFLLPGPPRELKPMFEQYVLPIIVSLLPADAPKIESRNYRVIGLGESIVESRIGFELSQIPDLEVGYCARPNEVDLRLIGHPDLLDQHEPKVLEALGENLASRSDESLETVIVNELTKASLKIAVAESCTGGLLANRITNVPGASAIFLEGFVTYANEAKMHTLGISEELLARHGAVSAETASAMAEHTLEKSGADFALSTTGIAGPGGSSEEKPVGTVFVGFAERGQPVQAHKYFFKMDRETFKYVTTQTALDLLRRRLAHRA
ncbi:MAG: competence/damage-inducible protein A [Chthoniobacterales bacterium]